MTPDEYYEACIAINNVSESLSESIRNAQELIKILDSHRLKLWEETYGKPEVDSVPEAN